MSTARQIQPSAAPSWTRIPDGTKVRHRQEAYEGVIDGLTEIVSGTNRNPDGRTQYRVKVDGTTRLLTTDADLSILLDADNLVMIGREKEPYRRSLTAHLRRVFAEDRFVRHVPAKPSKD